LITQPEETILYWKEKYKDLKNELAEIKTQFASCITVLNT